MKSLIYFGYARLDDMLKKGNVWYVRHYEAYFDRVYVVYLSGNPHEPIVNGNTTLVSLATGNGKMDLILSPYRLYKFARKIKPTTYLTADQVFSWWIAWLVKLLLRARIYLMPVCIPEQIYKNCGKSLSGFLIWLERILISLSYISSNRVLTGYSFGTFVKWLQEYKLAKGKLVVIEKLAEALPTPEFFDALKKSVAKKEVSQETNLIYVGRLHHEKLVDDLIKMLSVLKAESTELFRLILIGDGPERKKLEFMAKEMGVLDQVNFMGYLKNEEIVPYLLDPSSIFVSPLTGSSLREAALCGLPIVAYNMDWVSGFFEHEKTALLVPPRDYEAIAQQVIRLKKDEKLRHALSRNAKELAWKLWSPEGLEYYLQQVFGGD